MSEVNETPEPQTAKAPLPWDQLREARENLKLAQTDIASELKIDLRFIKALDEGAFERLPEPVFTAGYIRGYAKIVGLRADDIIAGYAEHNEKFKAPTTSAQVNLESQEKIPERYGQIATSLPDSFSVSSPNRGSMKNIRYAIIATAVVVFSAVIWQMNKSEEMTGEMKLDDASDMTSIDVESQPVSTTTIEDKEQGTIIKGVNKISEETKTMDLAIPGQKAKLPFFARSAGAEPMTEKDLQENAIKMSSISLEFTENSWVDIRDATGRHLIRSLGVAGNERTVKGYAPFEVLLGYGPGVNIEYNGKPYDFSEHQAKNRVARFVMKSPAQKENKPATEED